MKQFQLGASLIQQGAQHHHATFVVEPVGLRVGRFAEDELREAIKGKDLQPGVAVQFRIGEELAFELGGGLFGREQQERRAIGRRDQFTTNLREAAESLAAAGGAEQESRLHGVFFNRKLAMWQKNKVFNFGGWDGICPGWPNSAASPFLSQKPETCPAAAQLQDKKAWPNINSSRKRIFPAEINHGRVNQAQSLLFSATSRRT